MRFQTKAALALTAAFAITGVANAMPTMDYVQAAGAGDLYEKQSSQLVLKSTTNPDVRKFANMMVMDHTKSTAKVKAAAMKSGLHPMPPMLMPKQASMISDLKAAKGPARDQLYITQQKMAHQDALATQQDYASTGDQPALKMVASEIVPVVQQHIDMLNAMPSM